MPLRLLLVDALNVLYRSFYAIPGLVTAAGQPTNAVYGFIKTLAQLERLWQPSHQLVVFDGGTPPARLALCPEYKAGRPPLPPALRAQLAPLETYLDAARIARVRVAGQEADDVLASAAAAARGCETLVLSSDKDLLQIVDERVNLLLPGRVATRQDAAGVRARTGVRPDQIVAWLALAGDNVDHIAGVPGVGPKTAAQWLQRWETLDNLWLHLEELQPAKLRAALGAHRDLVRRNVQLIELRHDLPVLADLAAVARRPADADRLRSFYQEMEFHSLAAAAGQPTLF